MTYFHSGFQIKKKSLKCCELEAPSETSTVQLFPFKVKTLKPAEAKQFDSAHSVIFSMETKLEAKFLDNMSTVICITGTIPLGASPLWRNLTVEL